MRVLPLLAIRGTKRLAFATTLLFCLVVTSLGRVDAKRSRNSALVLPLPNSGPFLYRQHHDASTGAKRSVSTIRGGALPSTTSTATATASSTSLGSLIRNIGENVSSSKSKCWTVLIVSILTETGASTLSKHARDTGSFNKFLASVCLNLLWLVLLFLCTKS
jgi:hypothetical protein